MLISWAAKRRTTSPNSGTCHNQIWKPGLKEQKTSWWTPSETCRYIFWGRLGLRSNACLLMYLWLLVFRWLEHNWNSWQANIGTDVEATVRSSRRHSSVLPEPTEAALHPSRPALVQNASQVWQLSHLSLRSFAKKTSNSKVKSGDHWGENVHLKLTRW